MIIEDDMGMDYLCANKNPPDPIPDPNSNYQDPTEDDMRDPEFKAIWEEIKSWDINIPEEYNGYCGASGNHAMAIKNALKKARAEIREAKIKRITK